MAMLFQNGALAAKVVKSQSKVSEGQCPPEYQGTKASMLTLSHEPTIRFGKKQHLNLPDSAIVPQSRFKTGTLSRKPSERSRGTVGTTGPAMWLPAA